MSEFVPLEELRRGNLRRTQLLPGERDLFLRWFTRYGGEFSDYEFAVLLGPGQPVPDDLPLGLKSMVERVTRLRADFIARRGDRWWIFEIKPEARPSALGQLTSYKLFFQEEYPERGEPGLAVIAGRMATNMDEVFRRAGVVVYIV